jgi:flagellar protein FliO/FliZ
MATFLWAIFLLIFFAAAALAALWGYRAYTTGDTSLSMAWMFPPRPDPRLEVMEQASVDSRRKLVLIRRDDVEHLIMTGGPVDVVIETGIASARREAAGAQAELRPGRVEPAAPMFTRSPRSIGQAVNE